MVLASVMHRPGMLLNTLQCPGQPHNKELSGPNAKSAKLEALVKG